MPCITVYYICFLDRSSTIHIYRKQMLHSDEVYKLWYFNNHITTLLISEQKYYMLYRKDNKSQKEDLKWYMLSSKDKIQWQEDFASIVQ